MTKHAVLDRQAGKKKKPTHFCLWFRNSCEARQEPGVIQPGTFNRAQSPVKLRARRSGQGVLTARVTVCPTLRQDPRRCSLAAPGPAARPGGSGVNSGNAHPCALPLGSRGVHQPEEVTARGRLEEGLSAGSTADAHGRTGGKKAAGRTLLSSVGKKNHQVNSFAAKTPTAPTARRAGPGRRAAPATGLTKTESARKRRAAFQGNTFLSLAPSTFRSPSSALGTLAKEGAAR